MGPLGVGQGRVAQASARCDRRVAQAAEHRLRRPVPAAYRRSRHAARRDARSARHHRAARQGALYRRVEFSGVPARARARPLGCVARGAVRFGAAALQPAVPPDRARIAAARDRRRSRRDSVQPARGRLADGQARHQMPAPSEGRFTATVGKAGAMYTQRYWHEREFHTIEQINEIVAPTGRVAREHGARVGAGESGRDFGDHRREPRPSN